MPPPLGPNDIPVPWQIAPGMEVSYVVRFKPDARRYQGRCQVEFMAFLFGPWKTSVHEF